MKELPNGYRTVLTLHLFEGYDQEEIAEILQISHATVRTQYMRAKQKLLSHYKTRRLIMSSPLEKFVLENREKFDAETPDPGVWEKINERMNPEY